MNKLELLWQYQELEIAMDNYRRERNRLPIRKKLRNLKKYLLEQQNLLIELDEEASRKENTLNKIYHEYDNILNNLRINRDKIREGSIRNLRQVEQLERDAHDFKEKVEQKEIELNQLIDELEDFDKKLRDIGLHVAKAKKQYRENKSIYDEQARKINTGYKNAKNKRDELSKNIEDRLLAKYQKLKSSYKDPISLVNEDYCCSGCNMQVATLSVQLLKESDSVIKCENCGRILYMAEEKTQVS